MKNFGTLFGYELKKIWMRPLLWAALVGTMAASALGVLPRALWSDASRNLSVYYKDGHVVQGRMTEREKLRIELEWVPKLNGRLMDEAFFRDLRDSLQDLELYESTANSRGDLDAYFLLVDPTYYGYYRYANVDGDPEHITEERYYAATRTMRQREMDAAWYGKLTQEEIDYWTRLGDQVQTPYPFCYYAGWSSIGQTLSLTVSWMLPLLVGVCLCGVFPKERRDRTEGLIFSSRWGRFPVYLVKGLAGMASAVAAVLAVFAAVAVTAQLIYGGGWFNAPMQIAAPTCWPVTMGQAMLLRLGLYLTCALLCGGVVLLASLLTGSGVVGMAVSIFLMILQELLPRYFIEVNWIPGNILSSSVFQRYQLVELFGVRFNWVQLDLVLYTAAGAGLLALCWLGWRRSAGRVG